METTQQSSGQSHTKSWFVFALFVLLMALAYGGAELQGKTHTQAAGAPVHTVLYYHVVYSIWATLILLTPALCFYNPGSRNPYWRPFWTFSFLAFLTHLYWTIFATYHLNWSEIFHSQEGVATDPERVVQYPGPDLFVGAWWGLDVLLAWFVPDHKWVRVERGAVHLAVFVIFFGGFMAPKASQTAHILGYLMLLTIILGILLRVRAKSRLTPNQT